MKVVQERPSPGTLMYLLSAVREGELWGAEGKTIIAEFAHQVDEGTPSRELLVYFRDVFGDFLKGMPIDKALGLSQRRRGNPGRSAEREVRIAVAIWRRRMSGESHQVALEFVAQKFKCSERTAGYAWKNHKQEGLARYRLAGILIDEPAWTEKELQRARKIAGKTLGDRLWQSWQETRGTARKANALSRVR